MSLKLIFSGLTAIIFIMPLVHATTDISLVSVKVTQPIEIKMQQANILIDPSTSYGQYTIKVHTPQSNSFIDYNINTSTIAFDQNLNPVKIIISEETLNSYQIYRFTAQTSDTLSALNYHGQIKLAVNY